uniref:Uncharacterized protein n=1 Tax=Globodera rostochiensis TaxID=31243 RepID=A0A914HU23_GLORO
MEVKAGGKKVPKKRSGDGEEMTFLQKVVEAEQLQVQQMDNSYDARGAKMDCGLNFGTLFYHIRHFSFCETAADD